MGKINVQGFIARMNPFTPTLNQGKRIFSPMRLSRQGAQVTRQRFERLGDRWYPAACGLVGIDYFTIEQHLENAAVGFNQIRLYAE